MLHLSIPRGTLNDAEREVIAQVMLSCNNVQTKAAGKLGINRNTLHKKLKEYDIENLDMPVSPERVWRVIQEAKARQRAS